MVIGGHGGGESQPRVGELVIPHEGRTGHPAVAAVKAGATARSQGLCPSGLRDAPPHPCVSASQLAVAVGPGERRIGPGEPLELLCNVSGALPPAGRHAAYSVGWEMAPAGAPGPGRLVAQLDTEGVGSLGPGYEGRHIAMEKVASRTYRLRLEAARPGDAGTYRCLAKAYVRGSGARLREAASARSRPLPVHVREEGERGALRSFWGVGLVDPFPPTSTHQVPPCLILTRVFLDHGNTLSFLGAAWTCS